MQNSGHTTKGRAREEVVKGLKEVALYPGFVAGTAPNELLDGRHVGEIGGPVSFASSPLFKVSLHSLGAYLVTF